MPTSPSDHDANPHSLRDGVHDLRNVLNAVQMNAYAARKLVDEPARTLACIARIEAAVERGNGVLAHMPTDETLSTAALVLRERLRAAGGDVEVVLDGEHQAPVPGLLRQALCVVAVESQALGASKFRLWIDGALACEAHGLRTPGPIATALAESKVAELRVAAERTDGGWTFRWALPPTQ